MVAGDSDPERVETVELTYGYGPCTEGSTLAYVPFYPQQGAGAVEGGLSGGFATSHYGYKWC